MPKFSEFLRGLKPSDLVTSQEKNIDSADQPEKHLEGEDIDEYLKSLDQETLKDLLVYLNTQQAAEDAFADMASVKKEIKRSDLGHQFDAEYESAKETWKTAKKNLTAYQLTDELAGLSPGKINEETPGNPTLKVIRKLNLGTLGQVERELLKEKIKKIPGIFMGEKEKEAA